jgi:hypothetical protein
MVDSESFIFDEETAEDAGDVEAFCPKCKADTAHTVITKYEEEVRRVQCSPCGDVHAFRKPRGEDVEEAAPEPEKPRRRVAKKPTWEEFFRKRDESAARPYSFRDTYVENDMISHPKFGVGFASETMEHDKVEITFQDGRRILVHNRKDLPGAPPELARPPKPRQPTAKEKAKLAKAAAAAQKAGKGAAKAEAAAEKQPTTAAAGGKAAKAGRVETKPQKGKAAAAVVKAKAKKPAAAKGKAAAQKPLAKKPAAKTKAKAKAGKAAAKKPAKKPKKR